MNFCTHPTHSAAKVAPVKPRPAAAPTTPAQAGNVWFLPPEPDDGDDIGRTEAALMCLSLVCLWLISSIAAGYCWARWLA